MYMHPPCRIGISLEKGRHAGLVAYKFISCLGRPTRQTLGAKLLECTQALRHDYELPIPFLRIPHGSEGGSAKYGSGGDMYASWSRL
jgi:hypothetical protein